MKLIRFGNGENEKPGIVQSGKRWDCSPYFEDWNRDFFNSGGLHSLQNTVNSFTLNTEFHGNSKHVVFKNRKLLQKQFSYSRATSIFDWDTS